MRFSAFVSVFKQLAARLVLALVVIGLIGALFIWWPARQVDSTAAEQVKQLGSARQVLAENRKTLAKVIDPAKIQRGTPPTGKQYAEDIVKATKELKKISISQPTALSPRLALSSSRDSIKDFNALAGDEGIAKTYISSQDTYSKLNDFLTYHSSVMRALGNVLDYDAAKDFAKFDINSMDTQERLSLANKGLENVLDRLNKAVDTEDDPSSQELVDQIKILQSEELLLGQQGDLNRWIRVVKISQGKIQANRSAFWQSNFKSLDTELQNLDEELSDIASRWQSISS